MTYNNEDGNWRETYFTPEQWARVPTTASPWHSSPSPPGEDDRLRTADEIKLVLHALMVSALTHRQRQVMELYYLEGRTQVEVSTALGISQATVSQHLKGKLRGGHYVGGAFRNFRKAIHKAAARHMGEPGRYAELITALDALLDTSITRRRARRVIEALARNAPGST